MRLQHLKQIADGLSADDPARVAAKAVIVEEVERLHWRIWNGKAKDAQISIDRIRAVMHHFRGEPDQRRSTAPSRKLWTALHALNGYLTGQSAWLVNYAERHHPGLRVGTAITEGTANVLVNRRMNKSQQMRWSRRRPAAAGSVRRLQWHARFRLWTEVPASQRSMPANGDRSLTPNLATVPNDTPSSATYRALRHVMADRQPALHTSAAVRFTPATVSCRPSCRCNVVFPPKCCAPARIVSVVPVNPQRPT